MKTKTVLFPFVILLSSLGVAARDRKENRQAGPAATCSVSGTVIDRQTNEKLTGVSVFLADTDQKVYSDTNGDFSFSGIAPGTYIFRISCISYKNKEISVKITNPGKENIKIILDSVEP